MPSRHAVRGKSARELLWTSLSVLGRSTAGDGIAGRTSESAPEVNGISDRCSRKIPGLKITGGAHMWRPETEEERTTARSRRRQTQGKQSRKQVLSLRPTKERSHNSSKVVDADSSTSSSSPSAWRLRSTSPPVGL